MFYSQACSKQTHTHTHVCTHTCTHDRCKLCGSCLRNLKRKAVGNGAEKQANQPRISLEESPIMRLAIVQVGRGLPANLAQKFAAAAVEVAGAGNVSKSASAILRHMLICPKPSIHPRSLPWFANADIEGIASDLFTEK